jgi:hypothetical protein
MATDESYENLTDEQTETAEPVSEPVKRKPGRPKGAKYNVQNLRPFDSERARIIGAKANEAKKARAEMRRRIFAKVCEAGIDECVAKALKTSDKELMDICVAATKLTGLDFGSSEEAVQNLNVKADVDSKVKADYSLNLTFTDATNEVK